jgi:hypothetical protein
MKVSLLMVVEIEGVRDENDAVDLLDAYRQIACDGFENGTIEGFEDRECVLYLMRATDEMVKPFDIWDDNGERCFVPPIIGEEVTIE